MVIESRSPPVSPRVVAHIFIIQKKIVTFATLFMVLAALFIVLSRFVKTR
jgi:hypothetical protein